mgnify:CR=1 FL=1
MSAAAASRVSRRSVTASGSGSGAAPEPASWAIVIGRFGLIGGALPALLLVFALASVVAWLALRATMGVRRGQVKIWHKDINDL